MSIVNIRDGHTQAHDVILFITVKPNSEKYKTIFYFEEALVWKSFSCIIRKAQA